MNLQKIKANVYNKEPTRCKMLKAVDDCLRFPAGEYSALVSSYEAGHRDAIHAALEEIDKALAEFEKPADEQPSSEELEPFDPAIELCEEIRGYLEAGYESFAVDELVGFAEAYHQRKCAECKYAK